MKAASLAIFIVISFAHLGLEAFGELHVRIKNELGKDMKIKIQCRDNSGGLGTQVIVKGMAIEWRINTSQTTPYHCEVGWNELEGFHFEAYSQSRYRTKCRSVCSWHITERGPLLQNQRTGSWEQIPFTPLPEKDRVSSNHVQKCVCWPPKLE